MLRSLSTREDAAPHAHALQEGIALERVPTIAQAVDAFLEDVLLEQRRGTFATYRSLLQPLRGAHGALAVYELTPALMRQLLAEKLRTGKASSAATYRGCLAAFARRCRSSAAGARTG